MTGKGGVPSTSSVVALSLTLADTYRGTARSSGDVHQRAAFQPSAHALARRSPPAFHSFARCSAREPRFEVEGPCKRCIELKGVQQCLTLLPTRARSSVPSPLGHPSPGDKAAAQPGMLGLNTCGSRNNAVHGKGVAGYYRRRAAAQSVRGRAGSRGGGDRDGV